MTEPLVMKDRPHGFLRDMEPGETFDYIRELHAVLWRFVRAEYPGASGDLSGWLAPALAAAERRLKK